MKIVFFDDTCGLCDRFVQLMLKLDRKKRLHFAPLQGKAAKKILGDKLPAFLAFDTVVLYENRTHIYIRSKAVFRSFWHIHWWFVGWLGFLPASLFDWGYRLIAKNRRNLGCPLTHALERSDKERFLD